MKIVAFIFLFGISGCLMGQTLSFADYFPLKSGDTKVFYVSHIYEIDTVKDKDTYSFCRSLTIKGREIFYFEDEDDKDDISIIGSNSFCNGVFYFDRGVFFFSPVFWKYELKKANLDFFEILFPDTLKLDTIYKYKYGTVIRKYKFIGFETVKIKDKIFPDCLKLIVTQDWLTSQYIDTVWFQKGVGVVKWLRSTGRLEEVKL